MVYLLFALSLVAMAVVYRSFARKRRAAAALPVPSYGGAIEDYRGGKTLLVAVHAPWASVWEATASALAGADPAVYDLKLIDADADKAAVRALGVDIVPTVLVFKEGREVARHPNLMSVDRLG